MAYSQYHLLADAALVGALLVTAAWTNDVRWICFGVPAVVLAGAASGMIASARDRRRRRSDMESRHRDARGWRRVE
ncbi:MAG: hypothetical protein D6724_08840 [Armatimonadetes bacterium]|nr:MAG: hypothetical protein D6724_08840 [Armatimonadota bacterium]